MTTSFTVPIEYTACSFGFEADLEASIEGEGTLTITPVRSFDENPPLDWTAPTLTIPAGPFLAQLAQLTLMQKAHDRLEKAQGSRRDPRTGVPIGKDRLPKVQLKATVPIIVDSGSVDMSMSLQGGGTSVYLGSTLMTVAGEFPVWFTLPVEGLQAALEYIGTLARTQRTLAETAGDVQKLLADVYGKD